MTYSFLEWMELLSYVATVIGIPFALITFIAQEHKERQSEQQEIYDQMMEHYARIQDKLFQHPELDEHDNPMTNPEDQRRQKIIYNMLASLFERAFIMLYGEDDPDYKRMWNSWLDYINHWCKKKNFREALPELMEGEDPEFIAFMETVTGMKF
ncbi:MAG: hypothetical protein LRZ85_06425 [Alphaproteobacteria bacterium]|nr:hypothetical protein [Alphaproteobacteria bacterium]MCD8519958.1 hypothetical protein [Alphaproteobacteria bacterium]MCD8526403.1 hypothetical protein [Alphaproteobacteria bacterium]MCD8571547.1 hypothetical protein [Alphaproteobacteria bacterium]